MKKLCPIWKTQQAVHTSGTSSSTHIEDCPTPCREQECMFFLDDIKKCSLVQSVLSLVEIERIVLNNSLKERNR